jgi:V/A-type H+-transporting ATPase subunit E
LSIKDGLLAITNEVLEDVQKEAQAIIFKAENEAKQTLKTAKEKADEDYQTIIAQAKGKAENERRKITSVTEVEIRNRLLETKGELVDAAFEKTFDKLEKFTATKDYSDYLLNLIEQAAKQINSKNLLVQVNAKDKFLLKQTALNVLGKKLNCKLTFSDKTEEFIGGCKIETEDGKMTYDNTLDSKLRELKPALRVEVAKILFGEEV